MVFLYIAISIGVIILFREIVMWYWKINTLIENQNAQKRVLNSILNELEKLNSK